MTRYTAVVRRSDGWWAISVPQLKGVHSQAKRLDRVEGMARDAIALMLDVPPNSFEVEVQPEAPQEVAKARAARRAARQAEERAAVALREAVLVLHQKGVTVRDAGHLLDVSPARVSQIYLAAGGGKSASVAGGGKSASVARGGRSTAGNARSSTRVVKATKAAAKKASRGRSVA